MKSMRNLSALLMMGALFENSMGPFQVVGGIAENNLTPNKIDGKPKRVVPKGCKEYFFTENGRCEYEPTQDTVFSCIARKGSTARDKFIKWYNNRKS